MRSIVKTLITLFIYFLLFNLTQAQPPASLFSNITIASPNAASLGKYGDFPVSTNTGVPQIGIPIYTIKDGPLSLPINMNYHASGLKVMEISSWVGAGWALNAGGVITRSVVGAPDDRGQLNNVQFGHFSNYGYNSYLIDRNNTTSTTSCTYFPESNTGEIKDNDFIKGYRDGEPDLFFFNFCGYTGKFYFRDDRTPVMVPEADFKIVPVLSGPNDNIVGFVITTPDGTIYNFGKNQSADGNVDAVETTNPYTSDLGVTVGNVNSSWYLNRISSFDGLHSISLIYQAEKYSYYTISMFPTPKNMPNTYCTLVKNYMDGVRLSQINFANGTINFIAGAVRTDLGEYQTKTITDIVNTDAKSLDQIKISDNSGFCKTFTLAHSYFVDNTSTTANDLGAPSIVTDTKRLTLETLQEASWDGSKIVPPYRFTYASPTMVPRRLTFAQDHWGFNNGKTTNTTLIPTFSVNNFEIHPGADRESSWPESGYGILNRITYPTGGYTQFNFGPNEVWTVYDYYNDTYRASYSIGPYVGNSQTQTINYTTTGNPYKMILDYNCNSNSTSGGSASFAGLLVDKANPHSEIVITPGAGVQTYYLYESSMTSGFSEWASASIHEMVPAIYQDNKVIGGVRINSIDNYDGVTNNIITTNYNYRSGGRSNGVLYSRPRYIRVLRNDIYMKVGDQTLPSCSPNGCLGCTGYGYQISPSSQVPMQTVQGNHIGYNNVEVSQSGNGKSVYQYYGSNIWDQDQSDVSIRNLNNNQGCTTTYPNYPDAPLPFEYMRGELRYEAYFNQSNDLLKDVSHSLVFTDNPVTTPAYIAASNTDYSATTLYNLATAKKTKETTVTNMYAPGSTTALTTINSTFYESPFHNEITRSLVINSVGDQFEKKIKYAFDIRIPSCDALSDCSQEYNTAYNNALNTFNNTLYSCNTGPTCNCHWPAYQTYRFKWSDARIAYVNCRKSNFMNVGNTFTSNHNSAKYGADALLKPILELQDEYRNPAIEISNYKNGNLLESSFNTYDYSTNPTQYVYLAKIQSLNLSAPSSIFTPSSNSNSNLSLDSRYTNEVFTKYVGGNLVQVIKKDGVPTTYVWGYNNNYPVAKIVGSTYDQIPALSASILQNPASDQSLRDEINKIRTSLSTALVYTYTYSKVLGMSSETDASGKIMYYEYDALGHLKLIRDLDNNILKTFNYQYQQPH